MTRKPAKSISAGNDAAIRLVYDGECPVCSAYSRILALRELDGEPELIDARSDHPLVDKLRRDGFDLNEGMVLAIGDRIYHGAGAIHRLSLIATRTGWFNRLNYMIFRHPALSRILYPILTYGRKLLLKLLRRPPIG